MNVDLNQLITLSAAAARAEKEAHARAGVAELHDILGILEWQRQALGDLRDAILTGHPELIAIRAEMAEITTSSMNELTARVAAALAADVEADVEPADGSGSLDLAAVLGAFGKHMRAQLSDLIDQQAEGFRDSRAEDFGRGRATEDRVGLAGSDDSGRVGAAGPCGCFEGRSQGGASGVQPVDGHGDVSSARAGADATAPDAGEPIRIHSFRTLDDGDPVRPSVARVRVVLPDGHVIADVTFGDGDATPEAVSA